MSAKAQVRRPALQALRRVLARLWGFLWAQPIRLRARPAREHMPPAAPDIDFETAQRRAREAWSVAVRRRAPYLLQSASTPSANRCRPVPGLHPPPSVDSGRRWPKQASPHHAVPRSGTEERLDIAAPVSRGTPPPPPDHQDRDTRADSDGCAGDEHTALSTASAFPTTACCPTAEQEIPGAQTASTPGASGRPQTGSTQAVSRPCCMHSTSPPPSILRGGVGYRAARSDKSRSAPLSVPVDHPAATEFLSVHPLPGETAPPQPWRPEVSPPRWIAPYEPPIPAAAQERWQKSPRNAVQSLNTDSPSAAAQRRLAAPALPLQAPDYRPSLAGVEPLARTDDPWPTLLPDPLAAPPGAAARAKSEAEGARRRRLRSEQRGM